MGLRDDVLRVFTSENLELTSTHTQLSLPVIERIHKKMLARLRFEPIHVADRAIINGHHRYIASRLSRYELEVNPSLRSLAKVDIPWSEVELLNEDYDTPAWIKILNRRDAETNGITIEELMRRLE